MFSHVTLGTAELEWARAFYDPVMATLGLARKPEADLTEWLIYRGPISDRPLLIVMPPFDGGHAAAGNGQMVAFMAETRGAVDAFYATGLACGGSDEGAPGPRLHYHPGYYGAHLRDPDGNKIACACHAAERSA